MTSFVVSGADIVANPNVNTNSSAGQDGAGQINVSNGQPIFGDDMVVEFSVQNVDGDGEFSGNSTIDGMVVYADAAAYAAGTPLYTYTPMNPGQSAGIQNSVDGIGDGYLRFNANVLTSSDPGAPQLQSLFVAPGSDIANQSPMTFDHHSDIDYDDSGGIDGGTTEDGNGLFNLATAQRFSPVCFTPGSLIDTPRGRIPVEALHPGDLVHTLDNGPQPVVWTGQQRLGPTQLLLRPDLKPIFVPEGLWGAARNTFVSPQHCILYRPDAFGRAKHLTRLPGCGIRVARGKAQVTYIHLLLERHQVVHVDGLASESLFPGPQCLSSIGAAGRRALFSAFPHLRAARRSRAAAEALYGPTARPVVRPDKAPRREDTALRMPTSALRTVPG